MAPFFINKTPFTPSFVTGTVIDCKDFVSTEVYTQRYAISKTPIPGQIGSTTTQHYDLWLKLDDGSEEKIRISGAEISVRPGHRVSIVYLSFKGEAHPRETALINHSMAKRYPITSGGFFYRLEDLVSYRKPIRWTWYAAVLFISVIVWPLAFLGIPYLIYRKSTRSSREAVWDKALNAYLDEYGKEVNGHVRKFWSPQSQAA